MGDIVALLERIERLWLCENDHSALARWVRGKLQARLGEAHHFAGNREESLRSLEYADDIGKQLERNHEGIDASVSTILGGRGTRAYIRLLLDLARTDASRSRARSPDDWLPPLVHLNPDDARLAHAQRLQLNNLLRLRQRRTADTFGAMIDDARLAAAVCDYATALLRLDEAGDAPFHAGSSTEILLELATVRTRYSIDCVRWLSHASHDQTADNPDQRTLLANYLGVESTALRKHMIERIGRHNDALWDMSREFPPSFRYRTYARFCRGWLNALRANDEPETRKALKYLEDAQRDATLAKNEMLLSQYQMHLAEASALVEAISARIRKVKS
jgi:hypothetical protein